MATDFDLSPWNITKSAAADVAADSPDVGSTNGRVAATEFPDLQFDRGARVAGLVFTDLLLFLRNRNGTSLVDG